jgi:hypothetical protein
MTTVLLIIGLIITGILIQKTAEYLDERFPLDRRKKASRRDDGNLFSEYDYDRDTSS